MSVFDYCPDCGHKHSIYDYCDENTCAPDCRTCIEEKAHAEANSLLREACGLMSIPWVGRLVAQVVDSTLDIALGKD